MFDKRTDSLSGGEKQILNLASVIACDKDVLLLDEPASMLDPVMAGRLLDRVKKINKEFFKTVIITEHRTDELFYYADKIILLDKCEIVYAGNLMKQQYIWRKTVMVTCFPRLQGYLRIKDLYRLVWQRGINI